MPRRATQPASRLSERSRCRNFSACSSVTFERFFEEGDSLVLATTNGAADWLGQELRSQGIDAMEIGDCAAPRGTLCLLRGPASRIGALMRSGEDGRAERRPIHFAQDQSRLRREKPIDRQYRRATIAPWQRNTKVTVIGAMMVYGLKAKPLHRSPQMMGGAASIRTPSRAYANCLSACRRLSRAVHFRTFGRRLSHGALKHAAHASWLIVSSSDNHQKQQRQGLPSAAGSVSSCRPARKVRPHGHYRQNIRNLRFSGVCQARSRLEFAWPDSFRRPHPVEAWPLRRDVLR